MKKKNRLAIIAGGGTGGHLFPALAIGEKLEELNIRVEYIGSKHGIENKMFEKLGVTYHLLDITGIQRNLSLNSIIINILFPFRFLLSYLKSLLLIKKRKPSIIIGTGGYASGLPLLAGIHLNIPTLIQDQNSIPGIITKNLNNKISRICLAYTNAQNYLDKEKCIITGNPLQKKIHLIDKMNARNFFNLKQKHKTILILGGSQGASPINYHILKNINFYLENNFQLLWQCGKKDYDMLVNQINNPNIIIKKFISNMSEAYCACDLVISRAGAITISESLQMGKAMILIPYPFAAENHQYLNAIEIQNKGACIIIEQSNLDNKKLENKIKNLFENENEIKNFEKQARMNSKSNATENIVNEILDII